MSEAVVRIIRQIGSELRKAAGTGTDSFRAPESGLGVRPIWSDD